MTDGNIKYDENRFKQMNRLPLAKYYFLRFLLNFHRNDGVSDFFSQLSIMKLNGF